MPRLRPPPSPELRNNTMSAAELAKALGGRRYGRAWKARCPAHLDKNPSLSISDSASGRVLVRCHAGCEQMAVIDRLRDMGLWGTSERRPQLQIVNREFDRDDEARKQHALEIWNASVPATGTPVEDYLRSRGITLPIPASLRFHDNLRHHDTGTEWPTMVALVVDVDGKPLAIHRTYLGIDGRRDSKGKAPVTPSRMTLASCRTGAVRLGEIKRGQWLAVGEGIETTLSVMQSCRMPGWSALNTEGMKNIKLPKEAAMVLLCADNDANGKGQEAADEAGKRLVREGRRVRIAMPDDVGTDFNDALMRQDKGDRHVG